MNKHINTLSGAFFDPQEIALHNLDAELLRLGKAFEELVERERPIREKSRLLNALYTGQLERNEITFSEFKSATESGEAVVAFRAHEDIGVEIDAITAKIRAIRAKTIKGLAVKIRALAHDACIDFKFDFANPDDLNWDVYCFQRLFAETTDILADQ